MSELPKFKLHSYEIVDFNTKNEHVWMDTWDVEREDNRDFIYLEDYKSQIALWEKYKDNSELFKKDYFKDYKEFLDWCKINDDSLYIVAKVSMERVLEQLHFNDWLFDKLFKDGIV